MADLPKKLWSSLFAARSVMYNAAIVRPQGDNFMLVRSAIVAAGLLLALLPAGISAQSAQTPDELCAAAVPAADPATREFSGPEQVLEPGVDYRAIFCTGVGAIYLDLFQDAAPETVNNFVFLAQNGYYNNTTFHRVIQDFMAQGGDPTGTGTGGPGYAFGDEFAGYLNFDRPGLLAMANAGVDTNGSQFFITTAPTPHLDYKHTIFGEVLEGMDNVAAIELRDPETATTPGTSLETILIITDPAQVAVDVPAIPDATTEDLQAALDAAAAQVTDPLALNTELTGLFELDAVVAQAPEASQDALRATLQDNNFIVRASSVIENAGCALDQAGWGKIGFSLDVFTTLDDASAALASGVYGQVLEAAGFAPSSLETLPQPLYSQPVTLCDQPMTEAVTQWQRGRTVAEVRATIPATSSASPDLWITDFVGLIYERFFTDVLRAELR
jgi:cyclophilin family peptidyl-prolyl cis-trans isomerase